jgi:hypothetical protein
MRIREPKRDMKKEIKTSKFWLIPPEIYEPLSKEFKFDFDPCPYPFNGIDGIECDWGNVNWVNPPFRALDSINRHGPTAFVRKALEEQKKGKTSVLILPVISLLNMLFDAKAEIRPAGRVRWVNAETGERWKNPSNCTIFILRGKNTSHPDPITQQKEIEQKLTKEKEI